MRMASCREADVLIFPDRARFCELAGTYDLIPVCREILADAVTPVAAFQKLEGGPYRFLLESVEGGERMGRYSILGVSPRAVLSARGQEVTLETPHGVTRQTHPHPLE